MPVENLLRQSKENSLFFDKARYYNCLSPIFPDFLKKYLSLPILSRLSGVGLLCGTDWTPLYNNSFFYSRLDHSIGVALILWNFTQDKKQTLSGLLHDVSTPAFSHVSDFRKGDALKQESTEEKNAILINSDKALARLLLEDGLKPSDVNNYHQFSIADNEIPHLSSDRLEYMFPSGFILNKSFDMNSIERLYKDIVLYYNELGEVEVGFKSVECAEEYCSRFCNTGLVLQKNENKVTMQLLAEILNLAVSENIISEQDFFAMSEEQIISKFDLFVKTNLSNNKNIEKFCLYYKTFRTMKEIENTSNPIENAFCVSLDVKKRYINPLVKVSDVGFSIDKPNVIHRCSVKRVTELSMNAKCIVDNFLNYKDSLYGCVKLVEKK